jgi:hypothetical protein
MQFCCFLGGTLNAILKSVLGILCALVAAPVSAQSLHTAPRGSKVSGSFEIGGAQLPLPAGNWLLAGRGESFLPGAGGNIRYGRVHLIEVVDGKISRSITVEAPLRNQGNGTGWSRNKSICDRGNSFFNQSDKNFNPREARCLNSNYFIVVSPNNPSDSIKDLLEYLGEQKLTIPLIRVASEHWMTSNNTYIRASYEFNPEVVKISSGPHERWDTADWNRERIKAFPDKITFMEKVVAFGKEIEGQIALGLRGRLSLGTPVNIQVADWPVPTTSQTEAVTAPPTRSPAERLRSLEELKSRGLINEAEYQAQRQRIIDGL